MHVAGPAVVGQAQACTQCDAVLTAASEDAADYYVAGWLVGTDCKNAPPARSPRRKKTEPEAAR
jgi:thiamine monophosphate synthase